MSMPVPPPDTRAPGQTGHIADHNTISDVLAGLESAVLTLENTVDGVGISLPAGDLGGTSAAPLVVKIQGTAINASPGGDTAFLRADGTWDVPPGTGGGGGGGGGDGTVTSVSGETANGFVVSVNEETTTPQVTVGTSVTGLVKAADGGVLAAVPGTDYLMPGGSGADLTGITVGQVAGAIATESPTFTGEPSAPTASPGTSTTQLATTAFAGAAASFAQTAAEEASLPLPSGGAYPGGTTTFLRADGTWDAPPSGGSNPMTSLGDTTYGGSSGTLTRLPPNTSATKKFYTETGTGSAGTAPGWGTIAVGDVPTLNQSTTGNAATATSAAACSGNAATATNLAGAATAPAQFAPTVVPLAFGASIPVNGLLGNVFDLTLTASTGTLANPTGMVNGQPVRVRIRQGGSGGYTLAYGSEWDFGAAGAPTLSAAEGDCDYIVGEWDGVKSKVNVSSALGY